MAARSDTSPGSETHTLREIMMQQLSRRTGKSSAELFDDVRSDFGSCGERRLLRQLKWLRQAGCVRVDQEWDLELGYWRPIYFKTGQPIPRPQQWNRPQSCPLCGMANATRNTHPSHTRAHTKLRQQMRKLGHVAPAPEAERAHRGPASGAAHTVDG